MKYLLVIISVISQFSNISCQIGWVDPYDMNPEPMASPSNRAEVAVKHSADNSVYLYYLKRFTNLLLHSATLDKSDALHYHGHILFSSRKEDYDFLKQFANEQNPSEDILRKLDAVFSECLGKSVDNAYIEVFLDFHHKLYYAIFSVQTLGLLGACVMLYIVYQLFKMNFSFRYVFGYLFTIMLVVDFYLRYIELEKEAIEHNSHLTYSALCDTEKMNWYEYAQYMTSSRDCEKKVVTPLEVFLSQFKSLIIVPLHALGTGMGGFGKEMFTNLPWGLNLVMWPVMMLCCCIMAIFFMSFMTDQPIEFNFFHLVKMKFGRSSGFHMNNPLSGRAIEKLINTVCDQLPQGAPVEHPILNDRAPLEHERRRNPEIKAPRGVGRELVQEVTEDARREAIQNDPKTTEVIENTDAPKLGTPASDNSIDLSDKCSENDSTKDTSQFLKEIEKILDK